jgi:serine protease Do
MKILTTLLLTLTPGLLFAESPRVPNPLEEIGVDKYGKRAVESLNMYAPVVADARLSTAQVFSKEGNKRLAMATVVSDQGYLITKASEVVGSKDLVVTLAKSPLAPGGLRMSAKVVDTYRPYDLALLKVEVAGLRPVVFSTDEASLGTFIAATGLENTPITYGVVSVKTRNLDDANKGFLGVGLKASEAGLEIESVSERSAAFDAGLKTKDIVLKLNGTMVASVEEFIRTVGSCKPTEKIQIRIKRADEEKDIDAILRRRGDTPEAMRRFEDPRNLMSGALSQHRTGFPAALQHDLFLKPFECGGPLVNLDGHVVGINIAHSGRTESLAIPSATVVTLLKNVGDGKFFHPEAEELEKAKTNLEAEIKRLDSMEARLKKELEDVAKKLEGIIGK